jgi:hypothetical protein
MVGRAALLLALVPYAIWLVFGYRYHFIDGVNLAFHEAGHLFLGPFGQTIHVLGGTIGQLFFPAACAAHFLRQGRRFEAAICGIWFGESTMYMAEYLGDAKDMLLPLVGGHIHDWNWLLSRWGLLFHCRGIAAGVHVVASAIVLASFVLAGRALLDEWTQRDSDLDPEGPGRPDLFERP